MSVTASGGESDSDTALADASWQALVLHDLRASLTVVHLQTQVLRRLAGGGLPVADQPPDLTRGLERIERAVTQMVGMLDELQDLGGAASGPPPLRREPTDLVDLAYRVAVERMEQAPRHVISVHHAEAALVGSWDPGRLERALGNLVGNAVKYSPGGDDIDLTLWREERADGRWGAISVRDHGLGIPAADLPQVFERFFRAGNVVGRFEGAGLGLAGVRQVVEQHGGTISVESREGHGSTFTVHLPLAPEG